MPSLAHPASGTEASRAPSLVERITVPHRGFAQPDLRNAVPREQQVGGGGGLTERVRIPLLVLATAAPAAAEAAILRAVGFTSAIGLAPQASAVWPYGAYHDMRWVMVYHDSWPTFAAEALLSFLLRGAMCASFVALAWPAEMPRPAWRRLMVRGTAVTAVSGLLMSPWAVLAMAASVVSLSWFLLGSIAPVLLLSLALLRGGVTSGWWRGLPSAGLVAWSLLSFLTLTMSAALVWSVPGWWAVPVAAAGGATNAVIWRGLVRAVVLTPRVRLRWLPAVPLLVLVSLAAPFVLVSTVGGKSGKGYRWRPPIVTQPLAATVRHTVIVIAGHMSAYDGAPLGDPRVVRYSYRGLDARGKPLPYPPEATFQSLDASARLLGEQVTQARRRSGRPVALVGQSEGALVARRYLASTPDHGVDLVAVSSPPVRAGLAYFPPPGARSGWGVAAGWELRVLFALLSVASSEPETPDVPVVRSLLDDAPFYRNQVLCPIPGVRMVAFVPTDTATVVPPGGHSHIPVLQMPSFHGGLIHRPVAHRQLVGFLEGNEIRDQERLDYAAIQRTAGAWQAPALALSVNPAWRTDPVTGGPRRDDGDAAFDGHSCQPPAPR